MSAVRVRRQVLDRVLRHARRTLPEECCGLLIGRDLRVEWAQPAPNLRSSPDRFLVDPAAHFAAIRLARALGLEVIGAYHSHPVGAAAPSAIDRAEAHDPELLHLIVAPSAPPSGRFGLFRLAGGDVERLDIARFGTTAGWWRVQLRVRCAARAGRAGVSRSPARRDGSGRS
ncbi:MAG TPA: M67 family metallopeptidase [Vicinamibacterales bacterium]|nr:M67 family metallopeptidase [Vicinamibacterales bacterium]